MIKRILCIAAAVLTLSLCGCTVQQEAEQITPPFWRVEDEETGGTLYLLGTMHAAKPDIGYPDYIMDAYRSCEKIALELDLDNTNAAVDSVRLLMYGDGQTAKDALGDAYAPTVEFMKKKGLYSSYLDSYIPYYWVSVFSVRLTEECGLFTDCGTDRFFLSLAKKDGKEIAELESFSLQYGMMAELPMPLQILALSECIGEENYQAQVEATMSLYDAWSTFNEEELAALELFEKIPEGLERECDEMLEVMYNARQRNMADKAVEYMKNGEDVFLLVGAAHFYMGEDILTLLTEEGYSPVPIRPVLQQDAA